MRDLLSEGVIVDCRIGKTDGHGRGSFLILNFHAEHEAFFKTVLGESMRFYPEITNANIKLKPHARGYLLSLRSRTEDRIMFVANISEHSWPEVASISPSFAVTDTRAQVRAQAGEIFCVLPMASARKPPRFIETRHVQAYQHRQAVPERAAVNLWELVKGQASGPVDAAQGLSGSGFSPLAKG